VTGAAGGGGFDAGGSDTVGREGATKGIGLRSSSNSSSNAAPSGVTVGATECSGAALDAIASTVDGVSSEPGCVSVEAGVSKVAAVVLNGLRHQLQTSLVSLSIPHHLQNIHRLLI
jgi:hypothetical protein